MPVETYAKPLSRTDAGEARTHQGGILIPVADGVRLFPELIESGGFAFRCEDPDGQVWPFHFTHEAKPSESRITNMVPDFLRKYDLKSGDSVTFAAPEQPGDPYRVWFEKVDGGRSLPGEEDVDLAPEGAIRRVVVNSYERSPKNREEAIRHHGTACFGCDLEMSETYGSIASDFIHIHHIKPLRDLDAAKAPTVEELVPLCPNCHAVVHLKKPPLTIEQLRQIIDENRQ